MTAQPVWLSDANNEVVEASVVDEISSVDLNYWNQRWLAYTAELWAALRAAANDEQAGPSRLWDWRAKVAEREALANTGFALRCNGATEGLMVVETVLHRCELPTQAGKDLVYIEYLEAAPWNQIRLVDPPRYRGVGSALLSAAIDLSMRLGFKGRIGLHSLPESADFYRRLGLTDLGLRPNGLRYFEMLPEAAQLLLQQTFERGDSQS